MLQITEKHRKNFRFNVSQIKELGGPVFHNLSEIQIKFSVKPGFVSSSDHLGDGGGSSSG